MHPTAILAVSLTVYCNCQTDIETDLTLSLNDTWPLCIEFTGMDPLRSLIAMAQDDH